MTVTVSGHVCVLADGVKETSTTVGTGTYALDGAAAGFVSFATGIGNGNKTLYRAQAGTSWEIGVGTVATGAPPTLARTEILKSSNSDNAVSWTGTTIDIFVMAPAELLDQIGGAPEITLFTSSGTWTKPSGVRFVEVEGCGGGGGGGAVDGNSANTAAGGGGGGGGVFKCLIDASSLGSTVTVTIGQGGNGGASGPNSGSAGGTTSFGAFITATGGGGGTFMAAGAGGHVSEGGDGGETTYNASVTDALIPESVRTGSRGLDGIRVNGELAGKGLGADSLYGAGGRVAGGNSGANAGQNGVGYGSGGAGGRSSTTDVAGGDGADGVVIVRSYF